MPSGQQTQREITLILALSLYKFPDASLRRCDGYTNKQKISYFVFNTKKRNNVDSFKSWLTNSTDFADTEHSAVLLKSPVLYSAFPQDLERVRNEGGRGGV